MHEQLPLLFAFRDKQFGVGSVPRDDQPLGVGPTLGGIPGFCAFVW